MIFYIRKRFAFILLRDSGSHLLSHTVSSIVPSAAWVLTIVFGMRTGVSPKRITTRMCVAMSKCWLIMKRIECLHSYSLYYQAACGECRITEEALLPKWLTLWQPNSNATPTSSISLERRWSSRTFRYGYLVTTSPQLSDLPSAAPSLRLGHRLRAFPTPMVWRAVCTRPGNVFTAAFWSAITSDSSFM